MGLKLAELAATLLEWAPLPDTPVPMRPAADAVATVSPEDAARLMRQATYASVAVAFTLILAKLAAWSLSGSVSIMATVSAMINTRT